jgi:uncharacterized membrane protein
MHPRNPRFALFLTVLAATFFLLFNTLAWSQAMVVAFDAGALAYLALAIPLWRHGSPARIRESAAKNDDGRGTLLAISAIVIAAILIVLTILVSDRPSRPLLHFALVLLTVVLTWLFTNLVFTFHYAHLFYDATPAGVDSRGLEFPGTNQPAFPDFVYFAFVLGMTFQVSDVAITATRVRKVATFHGVLAFFFNLGVFAPIVNMLGSTL